MKLSVVSLVFTIFLSPFLHAANSMLTLENDAIVGKDNHYTNGLYYVWMSDDNSTFPDILKFLNLKQKNIAFSISHAIFTPKDKQRKTRNLNDLPYAGYLDFNFLFYKSSSNYFNEVGLNLGLVGPSARAGDLQKWFHDLIGHEKPKAWNTELKDNFLGGISCNIGFKTAPIKLRDLNLDTTLNAKGDIGNFYSGFLLGATVRLSGIPLRSYAIASNFIGANEALLLNYKKQNSLIGHLQSELTIINFTNIIL